MYTIFQTTADTLISQFGRSVTLLKPATLTFDPATGLYPTAGLGDDDELGDDDTMEGVDTSYSVNAIFVGINSQWKAKFTIEQGDAIALVSASGEAPEQNNILDGWRVIAVETVQPASVAVIYKCHVRMQ